MAEVTLEALAGASSVKLREYAVVCGNRLLAKTCNLIASAKDARDVGDVSLAGMYADRAQRAWLEYQEVDHVRRAQEQAAKVAAKLAEVGEKPRKVGEAKSDHVSMFETHNGYGERRVIGRHASRV